MAISNRLNGANRRERPREASRAVQREPPCFGAATASTRQTDGEALECPGRCRRAWPFPVTELSDSPLPERRTQPEEASSSSEEGFRLIVETIPGLIAVMTADGGVEHVNRQVLDYFGRTLKELRQWGTTDAVQPILLSMMIQRTCDRC
jgi:PAS domain-containing protein